MNQRIERIVTVEQPNIIPQAINKHFENLLSLGMGTAQREGCADCTHPALCGVAINALREKRQGAHIESTDEVSTHGVKIGRRAVDICPGGLIENALSRNQRNDFWLLEADELNAATLEVRTAQAVYQAAEDVRKIIDKKIII